MDAPRDLFPNGTSIRSLEIEQRLDEEIDFRQRMLRAVHGKHREILLAHPVRALDDRCYVGTESAAEDRDGPQR